MTKYYRRFEDNNEEFGFWEVSDVSGIKIYMGGDRGWEELAIDYEYFVNVLVERFSLTEMVEEDFNNAIMMLELKK